MTTYDPSLDHDPLFELPTRGAGESTTRRARSTPSAAHGKCPDCATDKPVGLVRQGEHLAWRVAPASDALGGLPRVPGVRGAPV